MNDYILVNGKKVALTDERIAEILDDTERRVEKGQYRVVYDSAKDEKRTKALLQAKSHIPHIASK
jgi:hypothetical protein